MHRLSAHCLHMYYVNMDHVSMYHVIKEVYV